MQVSQVQDHVTHAVIGGSAVINFGVSDDAELMNVLSKALYTDQKLAVIREGLCNAWDAHVEAGCTDRPIEITVDGEEIVIRDYGWGIPFDLIGPIYGTYGGSTKKHDGEQTGGFGLGCKSPFAYTDHFEVTSWSKVDGQMTIYKMSKSNAQVGGKPGIIPIVRVPNTSGETGLKVVIKLTDTYHRGTFLELVQRIASNGGMLCKLNGQLLDVLPFDEMQHNFLITKKKVLSTPHQIMLRYGHVIYPVDAAGPFVNEYQKVVSLLQRIPNQYSHYGSRTNTEWHIIFQAEPNSVSITPSREALSMQEHTINTIKGLLNQFLSVADRDLEEGCNKLLETNIGTTWLRSTPKGLFENHNRIPNMPADEGLEPVIVNFDQFVYRYAASSYPSFKGFQQKDKIGRLDALIEAGFGDTKMIESMKNEYLNPAMDDEGKFPKGNRVWFSENVLQPIMKGISLHEDLHVDKLFIFGSPGNHGTVELHRPAEAKSRNNVLDYMSFLRKVVMLTHNKQDFEYRAKQFPVMKFWLGDVRDTLLYTVARSPRKVAAAIAFFEKQGYTILDMTKAQSWEPQDAAAPMEKPVRIKPRRKGIPALSCVMDTSMKTIQTSLIANALEDQIENPEFVIKITSKNNDNNLPDHSNTVSNFIVNNWGKLGGIVVNAAQEAKYIAMGAMAYEDFILDKILEEFQTNPRIQQSLPFLWKRTNLFQSDGKLRYEHRTQVLLSAVYGDRDMLEYFGIDITTTKEDDLYLRMWDEVRGTMSGSRGQSKAIKGFLSNYPLSATVMDLATKIRDNRLMSVLDEDEVKNAMTHKGHVTPSQRIVVRDMLLAAIEG